MAIQTDEYGQPVLDDQGNPVQIPDAAPVQPAPVAAPGPAPVAPPPPPPRNNTYMGPNIGSPNATPQQFFQDNQFLQGNHSFVTPPTPDQAAGASGRVAAGTGAESNEAALGRLRSVDAPGSRTLGVMNAPAPDPTDEVMQLAQRMGVPLKTATEAVKAQQQFQALRGYKADMERGIMTPAQVIAKWTPFFQKTGGMTPYQEAQTKMRQQQLDQAAARANRVVPAKPDPNIGMAMRQLEKNIQALQKDVATGMAPGLLDAKGKPSPRGQAVAAQLKQWQDQLAEMKAQQQRGAAPAGTATGTTPPPAPGPVRPPVVAARPAPAAPKPTSPFHEGQLVRSKKDGKTYRIVNGVPVPVSQ
jgi:hypothetical protein